MEITIPSPDIQLKSIEIDYEDKKYICKIEIIDEILQTNIFLDNRLKYKGNIFLEKIQFQIKAFFDYNINEILEEINQLNSDNFSITKELNKYKLNIEFTILRRKKSIIIDLTEKITKEEMVSYYETIIKEKDKTINELKETKKILEEQLNIKKDKEDKEAIASNNFNISLKDSIHKLNFHTSNVICLAILNDGRLVSGSDDKNIIIYNKETYRPDLIIKEHNSYINCIIQLNSGILASCSYDNTIKLFNINENNYEISQTLNYHINPVYKIIELKNESEHLVSFSGDKSIIFYRKENSNYYQDYKIKINAECRSITQIKKNEICFLELIILNLKYNISFYNLTERKIKSSITNICSSGSLGTFNMINENLLAIGGKNEITIINVNQYNIIRNVEVPNSKWNFGFCKINKDIFLTSDSKGIIREWKIEGDNLILISKKEKAHDNEIYAVINLGNGHIASSSSDTSIKIW